MGGDTVAIDGKTMKGSRDGDKVTHIVSAWCSANNLVLGQVKTDVKSNEITAFLNYWIYYTWKDV